jgi:7-cyano-7-deazaguanine synthase
MRKKRKRSYRQNNKAVILLSGGLDSATTLYFAKRYGCRIHSLIFDYGQRHNKEIKAAVKLSKINKIPYDIVNLNLPWIKSSLMRKSKKLPQPSMHKKGVVDTYICARNIIFLSYATSLAESIHATKIFIGAHTQDYSGYPDCRPDFIRAMERAVNLGIAHPGIEIVTPLISRSKRDILKLARELRVPLQYTWSCYRGGKYPCGKCDSCRFRARAFKSMRLEDPLLSQRKKRRPPVKRKR